MNCLFCKILNEEIPGKIVYRDDWVFALEDINPMAPHHVLIIPLKHIATLKDLHNEDTLLLGHAVQTASHLAKQIGVSEDGYRLVWNCGSSAGQSVFHIHLHLLGGRNFSWPPG